MNSVICLTLLLDVILGEDRPTLHELASRPSSFCCAMLVVSCCLLALAGLGKKPGKSTWLLTVSKGLIGIAGKTAQPKLADSIIPPLPPQLVKPA